MSDFKPTICVDFDGVLHSYSSGWQGVDVVEDPPVTRAIEWLTDMIQRDDIEVVIYSSRSKQSAGIRAMKEWLERWGLHPDHLARLEFPTQKPAAFLTIDDRAICFDGTFPSAEEMKNFKPWNKR